jgi:hypothetical protein
VWMDVLLRAGVIVEVCRVEEHGQAKDGRTKMKKRTGRRKVASGREAGGVEDNMVRENSGNLVEGGSVPRDQKRGSEEGGLPPFTSKPAKRQRQMEVPA